MAKSWLTIIVPEHQEYKINLMGDSSIGRAQDNVIALDHPSVSRYHALIEQRYDEFFLIDLGSVNGILLNGQRVINETKLNNDDLIEIGLCRLQFHKSVASVAKKVSVVEPSSPSSNNNISMTSTEIVPVQAQSKRSIVAIIATLAGLFILITSILLIILLRTSDSGDQNSRLITISSPATGTTIHKDEQISLTIKDDRNIERVIYQIDGIEIERVEIAPYTITLNPDKLITKYPQMASGEHILSLIIEDNKGRQIRQSDTLLLAFAIQNQTNDNGEIAEVTPVPRSNIDTTKPVISIDINSMASNLTAQIVQKSGYIFRVQFSEKIRAGTENYHNYSIDNARQYRREIIKAFRDKGLHPLLGFVLALSQSRFQANNRSNSNGIGLWQVPKEIGKNYLLAGETENAFTDPKRGAEIAASYLKDLINVFGLDNFIFAIACYGEPINHAGELRAQLESETSLPWQKDFWSAVDKGIISQKEADRVVLFFAAGVVGENPRNFNLQQERLSSLY